LSPEEKKNRTRELNKLWRENNKDHIKNRGKLYAQSKSKELGWASKVRAAAKKKYVVELFGNKCQECGRAGPPAIFDFHHRNPEDKAETLDSGRSLFSASWETVRLELKKCDLLCANCHRLKHINNDPKYLADIEDHINNKLRGKLEL